VVKAAATTIEGALKALVGILGHQGMLQAVGNHPGLLRAPGDKIHLTAAAVKGLLGDSHGTNLLKEKPRLLRASGPHTEANFEILCGAFEHDIVVKAVRARPVLLYDRTIAKKAAATGVLVSGELREIVDGKL